jgi:hypothetical protein
VRQTTVREGWKVASSRGSISAPPRDMPST